MVLKCVLTAVGVMMAVINKYIVDLSSSGFSMTVSIIIAVVCTLFSLAGGMLLSMMAVKATEQYGNHIRSRLYEHILNCDWNHRVKYHSEELLSRLTSDISAICSGIVDVSSSLAATLLQLIMAVILLWHYDWTLAVFAIITGPAAAVLSVCMGRKLKKIQKNLQQSEADFRIYIQERISNADLLKSFEQEKESILVLNKLQCNHLFWVKNKNKWRTILATGISFVFSGSYLFAFISGAYKVSSGIITFGTMTAFLSLVNQVQTPLYKLGNVLPQIVSVLASAERVSEVAYLPEEVWSDKISFDEVHNIGICIKELAFSYDKKQEILSGISMNITPGQLVVVSGASGVGKTTVLRLLLGFIYPDQGSIYFYNEKGDKFPCSPMTRKCISYVPQGNTLLSGTVAENLRIGRADATEEQIIEALKTACAWEFVKNLPLKLDTVLGEKGYGLSEGQAQRIAIARGIIRRATLLVLDEATSALDETTERAILNKLQITRGGQTCLIVTHRHIAHEYADQIFELIVGKNEAY